MPQGRCAHGSWECGGGRLDDASLPEFRRTGRRNQKTSRGAGRDSRQSQEEVLQSGSYGCWRGLEAAVLLAVFRSHHHSAPRSAATSLLHIVLTREPKESPNSPSARLESGLLLASSRHAARISINL